MKKIGSHNIDHKPAKLKNEIYKSSVCSIYEQLNEYFLVYNTKPQRVIKYHTDIDSCISKAIALSRDPQQTELKKINKK